MEIFRVTVRGEFDQLTDTTRHALAAEASRHDVFSAEYRPEGSFIYELDRGVFSYRYEIRSHADTRDEAQDEAEHEALRRAEHDLNARHIGYKRLRATATNMTATWERPSGRRPGRRPGQRR